MASPQAVAADPSKGDPLLVPLGVPPAVQETLSGDCSEVSPSDAYLFTCGQPMSEDVASDVVEVSDCQCISAQASLTANLNVEHSEDCDVETVVDEGDANSVSRSILQNIEPPASDVSTEPVSSQSPLVFHLRLMGPENLGTRLKAQLPGFCRRIVITCLC